MQLLLSEIAAILGIDVGTIKNDIEIKSLLTDSRSLFAPDNTLFFAIRTSTNTGVKYIPELYSRGVRAFVIPDVDRPSLNFNEMPEATFLPVADPIAALQKIARRKGDMGGNVVMITGKRGKTTVKEMLFQLLEPLREIARSPRSYNSQIGVPLSMWEISDTTDLALIEAGMSEKGELKCLTDCICPDTLIITDIPTSSYKSNDEYYEEVAEYIGPISADSVKSVFVGRDDNYLYEKVAGLCTKFNKKLITWSRKHDEDADIIIKSRNIDSQNGQYAELIYICKNGYESQPIQLPANSEDKIMNAALALTFLLYENLSEDTIRHRFSRLHSVETRLSVSEGANRCNIFFDSYVADLSSLLPAVDFMMRRRTNSQKSIVIMGEPHHESRTEDEAFKTIARYLKQRGVDVLYGVGERFCAHAADFQDDDRFFQNTHALTSFLRDNPPYDAVILLKGTNNFELLPVKDLLEERTHQTMLEVNLDAMIHNYNYFKSHLPASAGMIAMVKAAGYGAGSYEIAKTLQDAGAAYLAVAVLDEGIALRHQGITMPIMVMNPGVGSYREMFANRLEPEIYTLDMIRRVVKQAESYNVTDYPVHLKLDTGMHRMGLLEDELPEALEILKNQNRVRISSVFSHLATADCPDLDEYTLAQLADFERCSTYLQNHIGYIFRRHILNSAGILRFPEYHYDMARLGIGLYGVNTLPPDMEEPLETVSSLKTVIINLREWKAGTSIGYARKQILDKDSMIATIPIGYADGMSRHFGNGRIRVSVNGKEAPTVGNICMDACMIDVSGIDCHIGDSVEIFGDTMPISRLSDALDTIPYEILTSVSPRVKRIYFRE